MLAVVAGVAIAIAALTGCAEEPPEPVNDVDFAPPETETPQPPIDEPNDAIELTGQCTNDDFGVRIAYPAGWETRSGGMTDDCSYFHPEPFDVPPATEVFDVAIQFSREPVVLDDIMEGLDYERNKRVLDSMMEQLEFIE